MEGVIVDSSAWIDFFRSKSGAVGNLVEELVEADRAYLTGPILAELLQGLKTKRESQELEKIFSVLPFIEVIQHDWKLAGITLRSLRSRGISIPVTDAVISAVAVRTDCLVLTLDKHFNYLPAKLLNIP